MIDPNKAAKLRSLSTGMQKQIDEKLSPAIASQNPTRRRIRIAESMRSDGRKLQQIQIWLNALADAWDSGMPPVLAKVQSKKALEILATLHSQGWNPSGKNWTGEEIANLWRGQPSALWLMTPDFAWTDSDDTAIAALKALLELGALPPEDPAKVQINRLENDLIGCKIPGYFPTPANLASRIVELADIAPGHLVLEPSAGKGNLAEAIRTACPEAQIQCLEVDWNLRKILKLKGFSLVGDDFLKFAPERQFDRIVMNPPFEDGQDCLHIRRAFDCLAPGGKLVSISSPSWTFNQTRKFVEFRDWLESVGGNWEQLPEGSFKKSDRSTGVNTCLIWIDKSASELVVAEPDKQPMTLEIPALEESTEEPTVETAPVQNFATLDADQFKEFQKFVRLAAEMPRCKTHPILNCLLLSFTENSVQISFTNLSFELRAQIPSIKSTVGAIAVSPLLLNNLLSRFPSAEVEFSIDADCLEIASVGMRYRISGFAATEYPELMPIPDRIGEMDLAKFSAALQAVIWAAASQESQGTLHCVKLQADGAYLQLAATNGKALAWCKTPAEIEVNCLLPQRAAGFALKTLALAEAQSSASALALSLYLGVGQESLAFGSDCNGSSFSVNCKTQAGIYP